jgi:predicted adenylyl cyclase CyaB
VSRNIEIKARVEDVAAMRAKVTRLADHGPVEIAQDDTFFTCAQGRLKLRTLADDTGELIFYQRPDQAGPKESTFIVSPTVAPESLRDVLSLAYGQTGRVRKQRTLFRLGRTRVHLDRVEGLGDFLELEVVLSDGESAAAGIAEAERIMAALGIDAAQLVEGAYLDLLSRRRALS